MGLAIFRATRACHRAAIFGSGYEHPDQLDLDVVRAYIEQLRKWDLLSGNYSAVCRTNVAPGLNPETQGRRGALS
jgi:hypothetical protein